MHFAIPEHTVNCQFSPIVREAGGGVGARGVAEGDVPYMWVSWWGCVGGGWGETGVYRDRFKEVSRGVKGVMFDCTGHLYMFLRFEANI